MVADQTPNPYQPPATVAGELDLSAPTEVTFQTNARLRRYATDQYLLHWHSSRLFFSSLIMIFVSVAFLIASLRFGIAAFVLAMVAALLISAAIYTALVQRTRNRIGGRLREFGLANDQPMTLATDADQLRLVTADAAHTWPNDQLRIHRTKRGLLICPEPLLFVFVPKKSIFQTESYKRFVQMIQSRSSQQA